MGYCHGKKILKDQCKDRKKEGGWSREEAEERIKEKKRGSGDKKSD